MSPVEACVLSRFSATNPMRVWCDLPRELQPFLSSATDRQARRRAEDATLLAVEGMSIRTQRRRSNSEFVCKVGLLFWARLRIAAHLRGPRNSTPTMSLRPRPSDPPSGPLASSPDRLETIKQIGLRARERASKATSLQSGSYWMTKKQSELGVPGESGEEGDAWTNTLYSWINKLDMNRFQWACVAEAISMAFDPGEERDKLRELARKNFGYSSPTASIFKVDFVFNPSLKTALKNYLMQKGNSEFISGDMEKKLMLQNSQTNTLTGSEMALLTLEQMRAAAGEEEEKACFVYACICLLIANANFNVYMKKYPADIRKGKAEAYVGAISKLLGSSNLESYELRKEDFEARADATIAAEAERM